MEPTGFFALRIDDPGLDHAPKVEGPATGGDRDGAAEAASGYSVRLGWIQGTPYLIDLGSADKVLVNAAPIDPYRPVIIQAGDKITIGNTHLTWNAGTGAEKPVPEQAGAEASKVTVVLPGEADEASGPRISEEPALGPEGSDGSVRVGADDETLTVAGGPRGPTGAQAPEVTVQLPRQTDEPGERTIPAEPASPPRGDGEPASAEEADATLLVPKGVAKQPVPEPPDPTLLVPRGVAKPPVPEPPDPTLLVPRGVAKPPVPEPRDDRPWTAGEAVHTTDETALYKTAWVDMARLLDEDTGLEFESTTILRDTHTPYLVCHLPNRTWDVQFTKESMTIGRGEGNDIPIPDESVSQHHARIERRGDDYVIRDDRSRNGVWVGQQRVGEHWLRDGDVVSLGRAKLVFKGGFTSDDLTLIGTPRIDGRPARRPVVFVPGLMGTELWIGSERLWPDIKLIISKPEVFRLPGDPRIEPRGIVNDVVIVPHIIQQRQYSALGDYLVAGLGYTRGKDLLEFGYDWRHDVRLAAQRLAEAIDGWQVKAPLTIIGHSLGTLVTRYYVERLGGKRLVERIILMGGPYHGTPKALAGILSGPGLLPFGMGDERMRAVLGTFPSSYQILPTYRCVVDQNGNYIDVLEDESWLPERQRPYLSAARSYQREVGTGSSVPAVSVFGYGLRTKLRVKIERGPDGPWQKVEFVEEPAGDQSVPSGSAVLKGSEIHPVLQEHGSLYVDDDVRMRLKVELTRSTTWQRRR